MRKLIYAILSLVSLLSLSMTQEANAQSLRMDVRNQQYNGDTLFFDIYLSRNGGSADYYLGNADFVLNYNNANFTSPSIGYVSGSNAFKNTSGAATTAYTSNIATSIGTSSPNTNKIMINVLQPSFGNQGQFEANIARIDTNQMMHRLGTFWIKGLQNATQSPSLTWVSSGSGLKTVAYSLNTTTPWKSVRLTSYTLNNPTIGTEPSTQVTAMSVTSKTDTSISLSWTRGNGTNVVVLAKQGSAVSTDLPTDGIAYDADSFGVGSQIGSTGVYVVYRGTATSSTVLNLDPQTHYYFAAVEVYGENGHNENYRAASPATANDTTKAGEPGTSATNLLFTAFSTSTLDLSWTSGSGANRIIVAKSGSAVSVNPTDAFAYTSTGNFTTGQDLGSGNIVVYDGSGTTASISGLTANTEYHFAVYEYNGSNGARNYKIDTPAVNDRFTLQTEPTVASSGAGFTSISTTSMTFHFTEGNGANRIILIHSGAAVDADPADGSAYTANATYGSGDEIGTGNYVVYTGSDSLVTVSGLTANTTYHYEVFEVNGSGESNNYLTSSTLVADEITLQSAPTIQASALTISNVTTSSMGLRWTKGNGAARVVVARAVSSVTADPVNGTTYSASATFGSGNAVSAGQYIVYNGTDSALTVTGLSQDTSYFFAVYEYNGSAGSQNYLTTTPATGDSNTAIQLNITAMLEGPFNGTDMDTVLNEIDSIPLTQPYNTAPWNYAGTESIAAVPYDVVDWVYVQVRRAATAAGALTDSVVVEQAGFLLANGLIMDSTGTTEMKLHPSQAGYGQLYVVVYHRNHIGVMSATTMSYSSDSTGFVFDFTSGASQAYGTSALILSGGKYLMYTGNADASGSAIDADDRDAAWDARNAYGYRQEDVNLDGNVTSSDRSAVYNNTGQDEQIP